MRDWLFFHVGAPVLRRAFRWRLGTTGGAWVHLVNRRLPWPLNRSRKTRMFIVARPDDFDFLVFCDGGKWHLNWRTAD